MLSVFRNMFRIRDLRNKIFFTLFIFLLYRLGAAVPVPGVDIDAVQRFAESAADSGFLGIINLFSGGALETLSVFALGIMPYITASIIMQLLAVVIPRLQTLQEEGEAGRKVITQWTRYLTVILALLQSTGFTFLFHSGNFTGGLDLDTGIYTVAIGPVLDDFPSRDSVADATRVNAALEERIRLAPAQYMWTLRWFKTRPGQKGSPYDHLVGAGGKV